MHYFAYGSNLDLSHMRRLCGWHCHVLSRGTLENYELGLDHRGYGNICQKQGEKVLGIIYEIDTHCIEALDEFEGSPKVFARQEVGVIDEQGNPLKAWVYIEAVEKQEKQQPNTSYWQRVVMGAKEQNLPKQWVKKLEEYLKK